MPARGGRGRARASGRRRRAAARRSTSTRATRSSSRRSTASARRPRRRSSTTARSTAASARSTTRRGAGHRAEAARRAQARRSSLTGAPRACVRRVRRGACSRAAPPRRVAAARRALAGSVARRGARPVRCSPRALAVRSARVAADARLAQLDRDGRCRLGHAVDDARGRCSSCRATGRSAAWQATGVGCAASRGARASGRWVPRPAARDRRRARGRGALLAPPPAWMRAARRPRADRGRRPCRATGRRAGRPRGRRRRRPPSRRPRAVGGLHRRAALLRGMVLGEDEALAGDMRDDFRAGGLAHLVAASGANVALLAALAWPSAWRRAWRCAAAACSRWPLIAAYVPLAGGGPSIQRAGIMGAAVLVAALAWRPASRWYALLLAAAVTLALNPRAAGDPGWQLSFAAVLGIFCSPRGRCAPRLRVAGCRRRRRGRGRQPRGVARYRAADRTALRSPVARRRAGKRAGRAGRRADHVARALAAVAGQLSPVVASPLMAVAAGRWGSSPASGTWRRACRWRRSRRPLGVGAVSGTAAALVAIPSARRPRGGVSFSPRSVPSRSPRRRWRALSSPRRRRRAGSSSRPSTSGRAMPR